MSSIPSTTAGQSADTERLNQATNEAALQNPENGPSACKILMITTVAILALAGVAALFTGLFVPFLGSFIWLGFSILAVDAIIAGVYFGACDGQSCQGVNVNIHPSRTTLIPSQRVIVAQPPIVVTPPPVYTTSIPPMSMGSRYNGGSPWAAVPPPIRPPAAPGSAPGPVLNQAGNHVWGGAAQQPAPAPAPSGGNVNLAGNHVWGAAPQKQTPPPAPSGGSVNLAGNHVWGAGPRH